MRDIEYKIRLEYKSSHLNFFIIKWLNPYLFVQVHSTGGTLVSSTGGGGGGVPGTEYIKQRRESTSMTMETIQHTLFKQETVYKESNSESR